MTIEAYNQYRLTPKVDKTRYSTGDLRTRFHRHQLDLPVDLETSTAREQPLVTEPVWHD